MVSVHSLLVVLVIVAAVWFVTKELMFEGMRVGDVHACFKDEDMEGMGGVRL
jgi:hypothetical protein